MDSWLYDDDEPFLYLKILDVFAALKEKIETGYFEELIQKYLLDNSHKSYVSIEPEKGLNARLEKELEEKLAAYKNGLSEEEIDKLVEETKHLKTVSGRAVTKGRPDEDSDVKTAGHEA